MQVHGYVVHVHEASSRRNLVCCFSRNAVAAEVNSAPHYGWPFHFKESNEHKSFKCLELYSFATCHTCVPNMWQACQRLVPSMLQVLGCAGHMWGSCLDMFGALVELFCDMRLAVFWTCLLRQYKSKFYIVFTPKDMRIYIHYSLQAIT